MLEAAQPEAGGHGQQAGGNQPDQALECDWLIQAEWVAEHSADNEQAARGRQRPHADQANAGQAERSGARGEMDGGAGQLELPAN
jgi:hypothetical protein